MRVCDKQCDQCLFGKNKIVSEGRKKEIVVTCLERGSHFICHKSTQVGDDNADGIVCRGWYENYGKDSKMILFAKYFDLIEFVPVPTNDQIMEKYLG